MCVCVHVCLGGGGACVCVHVCLYMCVYVQTSLHKMNLKCELFRCNQFHMNYSFHTKSCLSILSDSMELKGLSVDIASCPQLKSTAKDTHHRPPARLAVTLCTLVGCTGRGQT